MPTTGFQAFTAMNWSIALFTFQRLVEDTRRELARHYLKQAAMELNDAALLLGFRDANSFFRAFHGWEGTSPGEWRTRLRKG
jgi:AraC-like DNA-binding protein